MSNGNTAELFNSQYDSHKLQFLTTQVAELSLQNEELKRAQAKAEKDTHEFVAYFQRELGKKEEAISSITDKAVSDKVKHEMEMSELKKESEDRFTTLKVSTAAREADLTARLKLVSEFYSRSFYSTQVFY